MRNVLNKLLCLVLALLLLPLPVMAASEATFNANAFELGTPVSGANSFIVSIGDANKAVLEAEAAEGRTVQATVDCPFGEAHVFLLRQSGEELVESTMSGGKITFRIPTSGDYKIVEGKVFKIANTNMVFGNSLKMNFWIRKSDLSGNGYQAVVTKYYEDGSKKESIYPFAQWEDYNSSYYRVSCDNIAAKEMSDLVTVQIFHTDGTVASYLYTDSVRSYAMDMLKYYRSGKLATALVDMLNYGAAAQDFFNYNEADLANKALTETQQGLATQHVTFRNKEEKDSNCYGSSLTLESNIILNLYFKNVTEDMRAEVEFTDHYGKKQAKTYTFAEFCKNKDKEENVIYGVPVNNLVVADGRQPVTCRLYKGETLVSTYVSSVENYVAIKQSDEVPLYEATLKFVDSAHAYFHP